MTDREQIAADLQECVDEGYISEMALGMMLFEYDVARKIEETYTDEQIEFMSDEEYNKVYDEVAKKITSSVDNA